MPGNRILSQMFDVRPVNEAGDLDWEKIEKLEGVVRIRHRRFTPAPKHCKLPLASGEDESLVREFAAPLPPPAKEEKIIVPPADYSSAQTRVKKSWVSAEQPRIFAAKKTKKARICQLGRSFSSEEIPVFYEISVSKTPAKPASGLKVIKEKSGGEDYFESPASKEKVSFTEKRVDPPESMPAARPMPVIQTKIKIKKPAIKPGNIIKETDNSGSRFSFSDFFLPRRFALSFGTEKLKKAAYSFAGASLAVLFIIFIIPFYNKSLDLKNKVLGVSTGGFNSLEAAAESVKRQDFGNSSANFQKAYENFSQASEDMKSVSGLLAGAVRYIPVISQISSGKNAVEAGKHLALAGDSLSQVAEKLEEVKNPIGGDSQSISLLEIFQSIKKDLEIASAELVLAQEFLSKISIDDLPEEKRADFLEVKNKLPATASLVSGFLGNSDIFSDLLGGNGPRKYLFLFQNNQEMRATGGFIGSYGMLDIKDGRVRKFFVDNIFNPDGQLKENIVPPNPIMKISAAWSLHDSNWWPDFPRSARKATLFYEKTGGPTADGIIAVTPAVMQKLLEVTGPIEMPDYAVTLDADNFVAKTQYEVEEDYDKEENQPKKILADLAPIVLDKIFNSRDFGTLSKSLEAVLEGLGQKHILLYSENESLQKIISAQGWSGEILETSNDYLSVVNSNINGYKTDGVIEEKISHEADIQEDGSIVDTVTITRRHNGGNTDYEWWNKVNADYMRVYAPLNSRLLEVSGQTREFTDPPLDYGALGFKRDAEIEKEEKNMSINQETGTRTYEDSGKTVFANWVYASPGETAEIKYEYLLPFRVEPREGEGGSDSYSILFQKQSGSAGSQLISTVKYPDDYKVVWNYPENILDNGGVKLETDLKTDKFVGVVFERE